MKSGRPPTTLSPEEHQAFSRRYLFDADAYVIVDVEGGERISMHAFRQRHGIRGDLWLTSRPTSSATESLADPPPKNSYVRKKLDARDALAAGLWIIADLAGETTIDPEELLDTADHIINGPHEQLQAFADALRNLLRRIATA